MSSTLTMAPAVRFHLSLNVGHLGRAVDFYRTLFGREPAKLRPDYAKFELDDPPLVLSLEPNARGSGGALNHAGFRMPDSTALVAMQERLERAGIRTNREEGVECCYARQTKFWVTDPDRTLWEIYTLEEDLDHRGAGQTLEEMLAPQEEGPAPIEWEHRMGDPVPASLALATGSADEVRLRGSFNAELSATELAHLVREAKRVLRPGGKVVVHTLVADRPFPGGGSPRLSGPAAHVRRVPPETEAIRALEAAGFLDLHLSKFGASPCFQQDGVEMREQLLEAMQPGGPATAQGTVVYKGPFREVRDDAGTVYRRGERVVVDAGRRELLQKGPAAEQLTFPAGGGGGCSAGH